MSVEKLKLSYYITVWKAHHIRVIISHWGMASLSDVRNPIRISCRISILRISKCSLGNIGRGIEFLNILRLRIFPMQRSVFLLCSSVGFSDEFGRGQHCCVRRLWGRFVGRLSLGSFSSTAMPGDISIASRVLDSISIVFVLLGDSFVQDFLSFGNLKARNVLTLVNMG